MAYTRESAIRSVVDELTSFTLDVNQYYGDAEPASMYDSFLPGHLSALLQHCDDLGWVPLVKFITPLLPVQHNAIEVLESVRNYITPEVLRLLERIDVDALPAAESFWDFIHPRIKAIAKPRFEAGFYADSVEASLKEVNSVVKQLVHAATGRELDGAGLMTTAFSPTNPLVRLDDLGTETGRNIQQGYMQIFAGAMTGIRNPKAHANIQPDRPRTIHLLVLSSLLLSKLDERVE
jgi:uncharacterized protein (TIGR02391 family)